MNTSKMHFCKHLESKLIWNRYIHETKYLFKLELKRNLFSLEKFLLGKTNPFFILDVFMGSVAHPVLFHPSWPQQAALSALNVCPGAHVGPLSHTSCEPGWPGERVHLPVSPKDGSFFFSLQISTLAREQFLLGWLQFVPSGLVAVGRSCRRSELPFLVSFTAC